MGRVWFLQANPKQYDIDSALGFLDRIWWRVPQYTSEIHVGDVVVLWRSGAEAGIVGVGRVVAEPRLQAMEPAEKQFVLSEEESSDDATRALLHLRSTPFVGKDQVRAIPQFHEHQMVRAPMGTVFAVSDAQWAALSAMLPAPPEPMEDPGGALPPAFGWPQRAKGVLPMPGGYNGYLASLAKVCKVVAEERPTPSELAARLEDVLDVKATAARLRESFLRKTGIVSAQGGICKLSSWAEKWRDTGDDRIVTALLHSRCQFVGELLAAAREPRTNDELLKIANERYAMGWDTQTQIVNRRGWLQSAGMLAVTVDGKIQITAAGAALLTELVLYEPGVTPVVVPPVAPPAEPPVELAPTPAVNAVDAIIDVIEQSATPRVVRPAARRIVQMTPSC
jgi:hypothetical protein